MGRGRGRGGLGRGRGRGGRGGRGRGRGPTNAGEQQPGNGPLEIRLIANDEYLDKAKSADAHISELLVSDEDTAGQKPGHHLHLTDQHELLSLLTWFREGSDADAAAELVFPAHLSKRQRAHIHSVAEQVGLGALETFSRGVGEGRYISVMRAGSAPKRELTEVQQHKAFHLWQWAKQAGQKVSRDEVGDMVYMDVVPKDLVELWNVKSAQQKVVLRLCEAVRADDADAIKAIAEEAPEAIKAGDWDVLSGVGPLHLAAAKGLAPLVELLLQLGSPVDAPDGDGLTPLQLARKHDQSDAEGVLLRAGAKDSTADHFPGGDCSAPVSSALDPSAPDFQPPASTGVDDCISDSAQTDGPLRPVSPAAVHAAENERGRHAEQSSANADGFSTALDPDAPMFEPSAAAAPSGAHAGSDGQTTGSGPAEAGSSAPEAGSREPEQATGVPSGTVAEQAAAAAEDDLPAVSYAAAAATAPEASEQQEAGDRQQEAADTGKPDTVPLADAIEPTSPHYHGAEPGTVPLAAALESPSEHSVSFAGADAATSDYAASLATRSELDPADFGPSSAAGYGSAADLRADAIPEQSEVGSPTSSSKGARPSSDWGAIPEEDEDSAANGIESHAAMDAEAGLGDQYVPPGQPAAPAVASEEPEEAAPPAAALAEEFTDAAEAAAPAGASAEAAETADAAVPLEGTQEAAQAAGSSADAAPQAAGTDDGDAAVPEGAEDAGSNGHGAAQQEAAAQVQDPPAEDPHAALQLLNTRPSFEFRPGNPVDPNTPRGAVMVKSDSMKVNAPSSESRSEVSSLAAFGSEAELVADQAHSAAVATDSGESSPAHAGQSIRQTVGEKAEDAASAAVAAISDAARRLKSRLGGATAVTSDRIREAGEVVAEAGARTADAAPAAAHEASEQVRQAAGSRSSEIQPAPQQTPAAEPVAAAAGAFAASDKMPQLTPELANGSAAQKPSTQKSSRVGASAARKPLVPEDTSSWLPNSWTSAADWRAWGAQHQSSLMYYGFGAATVAAVAVLVFGGGRRRH